MAVLGNVQGTSKCRRSTLGRLHADLAQVYRTGVEQRAAGLERAGLRHLCAHLDAWGRLSGDATVLYDQLSHRGFRDRQREVFGDSRQTLLDLAKLARSAVHHDRADQLAEAVDWYGRTIRAAQVGLQGWARAHQRGHIDAVFGIVNDCGRPEVGRCLLAHELWARTEDGREVPEKLLEALQADAEGEPTPYRVLAARILTASRVPLPHWAVGLEPWTALTLPVYPPPTSGWPGRAWRALAESEAASIAAGKALAEQPEIDRGRQMEALLVHVEQQENAAALAQNLSELLLAIDLEDWWPIATRDAICAMGTRTRDALLATGFGLVAWWRRIVEHLQSDHQSEVSMPLRHMCRLAMGTPLVEETTDLVLDWGGSFPEAWARGRMVAECPGLLAQWVERGLDRSGLYERLEKLMFIESSAIPEVTSDYLLFGLGHAVGRHGDRDAIHLAFERIRNHWIRGQLICVQPVDRIAGLDLSRLPGTLGNPLAMRFALTRIFDVISPTCPLETLEVGLRTAASCEPYPEIRVAGLETVLSGLAARADKAEVLERFWTHHAALLDIPPGYQWRVVHLLIAGGCTPELCPAALQAWLREVTSRFSNTQRSALAELTAGPAWGFAGTGDSASVDSNPATGLRVALTSRPPDLAFAQDYGAGWSAEEWVVWTNGLEIVRPEGLGGLPEETARFLVARIAPAEPSPSSVFSLLELARQTTLDPDDSWPEANRDLLVLAVDPTTFTPAIRDHLPDEACWDSVLDWMIRGRRSDQLLRTIGQRAVGDWLRAKRDIIARSEYGRSHPIVRYPGRALLSWLMLMHLDGVRPAQILAAQLLTREAHPEELERLKASWLKPGEAD